VTTVDDFLCEVSAKFDADFASFEVYQFLGTANELASRLAVWSRPRGVTLLDLDIAGVSVETANATSAKAAIELALKDLGEVDGRLLLSVHGLHLLALLYPGGLLQHIKQWLRRDSRVVILVVPTLQSLKLPDTVKISDWRTSLSNELGTAHTLIHGGE
jgi:hypothetical protein